MPKTVLLTLGRLPKALELARALYSQGARVIVAEPFGLHVCKASRAVHRSIRVSAPNTNPEAYSDEIADIIRRENIDLVIPVSEEALYATAIADRLPDSCRIFGPGHEQIVRLHDKLLFNRRACEHGLDVPETHPAGSIQARALSQRADYVIKPAHGCSGIGVSLHRKEEPIGSAANQPGLLVQSRLRGRHISSFTIAHNGRVVSTILYQGRIYAGTVCVCFERVDDCPLAHAWVSRFVAAENYSGFISFDFIEDDDGLPHAIECNPRITSGIHFADPTSLARAVLHPDQIESVSLRTTSTFQEGHTALLEVYGALMRPTEFARRLKAFLGAKDVLFRLDDPLPFLLFTPLSWPVLRQVLTSRTTLGEAATRDITWTAQGDSQPADAPEISLDA